MPSFVPVTLVPEKPPSFHSQSEKSEWKNKWWGVNAEAAEKERQSMYSAVTQSGTTLTKEMSKPHSK